MSSQGVYRIIRVRRIFVADDLYLRCLVGAFRYPEEQRSMYVDLLAAIAHIWITWLCSELIGATAIAVACRDSDVQNVKAMIVGPPETPYEFGFFDVSCKLGNSLLSTDI